MAAPVLERPVVETASALECVVLSKNLAQGLRFLSPAGNVNRFDGEAEAEILVAVDVLPVPISGGMPS